MIGIALGIDVLVHPAEVGTRLHLDVGVALLVEDAHKILVLQKGSPHRHRLLVVKHAAVGQIGRDVVGGEAVLEQERVLRVLVIDHVGDHDVAHLAVEGRRLAHKIDPLQLAQVGSHLAKDLIGSHAQRIVHVKDDSVALLERLQTRRRRPAGQSFRGTAT